MASINVTSTAYPITQAPEANQLPFTFNDVLLAGYTISFAFNLDYLNNLRNAIGGGTVLSSDINSNLYSLQTFLCDSIDGSNNLINVQTNVLYNLSASNLASGIVSQTLYGATASFRMSHEDLGATMSQQDILKLYKEYNIVLRLTPSASPVTTQVVQNADIVHPVKLMLDTLESGPYDIEFNNVDLLNPEDFTESELLQIYSSNPSFIGNCSLRCCYPKNHSSLSALPFILFMHGQDHNSCMYDAYLNYFASYGYFAATVQRENGVLTIGANEFGYTRCGSILQHLKVNKSLIAGGLFENTIDFTKVIFVGHSLGGADVKNFTTTFASGFTQTPPIPGFNQANDLISIGYFEASVGENLGGGLQNLTGPMLLVSGSSNSYIGSESIGILQQYYARPENVIDGGVYMHLAGHENMAEPFSPVNSASISPQVYYGSPATMFSTSYNNSTKPTNSRSHQLIHTASQMLKLLSQYFSNKGSLNTFTNTNIQYKPNIFHDFEKTTIKYARLPITGGLTFIDNLQNISKFSSNATGATFVEKCALETPTLSYYSVLESRYFPTKFLSLNPQYRNNGLYVFPYNNVNITLGYTFGTALNFGGNSFIGVPLGLIMEAGATLISGTTYYVNSIAKETHQHFTVELKDSGGITSWLSSKQNNMGIDVPQSYMPGYTNGLSIISDGSDFARSLNTLYFKCSDFKQLKPSLNLSQINEINLLIGPSYGISGGVNGRFAYNGLFTF